MKEGGAHSMWNFLEPVVRPIAGWWNVRMAVATIVYEEDIEPRTSSAYLRLRAFWNEFENGFTEQADEVVILEGESEEVK